MNNTQLKYARERLYEAKQQRERDLPYRYGYDAEQKDKLFEEGKYKVVKTDKGSYTIKWEGEEEFVVSRKQELEVLNKQYKAALDQLVLGDVDEALVLINNFVEGK